MKQKKPRTTITLSYDEWAWARTRMIESDWDRAGEKKGVSRYVQELIEADMRDEKFTPLKPVSPGVRKKILALQQRETLPERAYKKRGVGQTLPQLGPKTSDSR